METRAFPLVEVEDGTRVRITVLPRNGKPVARYLEAQGRFQFPASIFRRSKEEIMLDGFFKPNAVVVIGASREEGKVGFSIVNNLVQAGFPGPIYPVNPKASEIRGLPCYPDLAQVPDGA